MGKVKIDWGSYAPKKKTIPSPYSVRIEFNYRTDLKTRKESECCLDVYFPVGDFSLALVEGVKNRTDSITYTSGGAIQFITFGEKPVCRIDITGYNTDGRCKWCINFRKLLKSEAKAHRLSYEEIRCCKYGSSEKYDLMS